MGQDSLRDRTRRTAVGRAGLAGVATVERVGSVLAAVAVAAMATVRLGRTVPFGSPPVDLQALHGVVEPLSVAVPAAVAVVVGASTDTGWEQVGLTAAGTFAVLAALGPAGAVPATGVLAMAAVMVVGANASRPADVRGGGRLLFGGATAAAVVVSAGANLGVLPPGGRSLATTAALVALVAAPLAVGASRRAALAGAAVATVVLVAALSAPFLMGATWLAVGAAYDPNVVLAAAGVGGAVATAVHGVLGGRPTAAAAGVLLLAAGVPASVDRALAVVLGAGFLLRDDASSGDGGGASDVNPRDGDASSGGGAS